MTLCAKDGGLSLNKTSNLINKGCWVCINTQSLGIPIQFLEDYFYYKNIVFNNILDDYLYYDLYEQGRIIIDAP